jgi:hypothetical protein
MKREKANIYILVGNVQGALDEIEEVEKILLNHYQPDSIRFDKCYMIKCQCYSMLSDKRNLQIALDKLTRLAQKYYHESHTIYATINKYTEILKTM